jgi:hypothetical protein
VELRIGISATYFDMNKAELSSAIEAIDADVKIEGLRVKELELIHAGLTLPTKVKGLENDIAELNETLAAAEEAPKQNDGRTFVGEIDDVKYYMTIPVARIGGKLVKAEDMTEAQLAAAVKVGAQFIVKG